MTSIDSVVPLARRVRRAVKRWIVDKWGIDQKSMQGACAIASYTLKRALDDLNFDSKMVIWEESKLGGECHCWNEIDDFVIDTTATQFGKYPSVLVVERSKYDVIVPTANDLVLVDPHLVMLHLKDWRGDQNPLNYEDRINSFLSGLHETQATKKPRHRVGTTIRSREVSNAYG